MTRKEFIEHHESATLNNAVRLELIFVRANFPQFYREADLAEKYFFGKWNREERPEFDHSHPVNKVFRGIVAARHDRENHLSDVECRKSLNFLGEYVSQHDFIGVSAIFPDIISASAISASIR
jgi:hypothetical protein